jgi:dynein heavy chain 2
VQVLERIARYDRVLSQPGGSLLLTGPCGSGRRSVSLLMAYMHHLELFTPKMTR